MIVYRDLPDVPITEALQRGRSDPAWFSWYFLRRRLHDGQAEFVQKDATINVLATSNRWGKTTVLTVRHLYACFYKVGAEPKFIIDGNLDVERYLTTKFYTVHTAGLWDTAKLVWDDFFKIYGDAPRIRPFIKDTPRTLPPHVTFTNGSRWLFRTLGDHGEGIDGHSFYLVSIDEAGWIVRLEEILDNVARVRVADVQGMIDIVGTMKQGISRDFYRYAHRAAVETGSKIGFDHRDGRDYSAEFSKEIARAQ